MHIDLRKRIESLKINPDIYGQFMRTEPRIYNRERTTSSINDVGRTGQYASEWNWIIILYHTHKKNPKWVKGLGGLRPETMKLPEDRGSNKLLDTGLGDNLLNLTEGDRKSGTTSK